MSIIKRLFKRNRKGDDSAAEIVPVQDNDKICEQMLIPELDTESENSEFNEVIPDGTDTDDVVDKELYIKRRQLNNALRKARRQEERLQKRQKDIVALDGEIGELMWIISLAKKQKQAVDQEMLNKKCELRFLKTEAPESLEAEVRKREPLFFKKYNAIKTSSDAKNMMHTVRQRQRALQYLELMIFNKYLELQYNLKSDEIKKRTSLLSKDKSKHFGHLMEALNLRSNLETHLQNQLANNDMSSPGRSSQISETEPSDNSRPPSTTETPTTAVQTGSQSSTPRDGTPRDGILSSSGGGGLVFHLATTPGVNARSPTPILESFL